jgi:hypothetical protein
MSDPKSTALSLVEKYRNLNCNSEYDDAWICEHLAKACAIIAVDLVIENIINCENQQYEDDKLFWEEVKIAINKL